MVNLLGSTTFEKTRSSATPGAIQRQQLLSYGCWLSPLILGWILLGLLLNRSCTANHRCCEGMNEPSLWHLEGTIDVQSSQTSISYNLFALFSEIVPEPMEGGIILPSHSWWCQCLSCYWVHLFLVLWLVVNFFFVVNQCLLLFVVWEQHQTMGTVFQFQGQFDAMLI